jgi:hypothetical protein
VTPSIIPALIGGAAILFILLKHSARRSSGGGLYWTQEDEPEVDSTIWEIPANIFSRDDSDFVAGETSAGFARKFRDERAIIALCWVRRVRREVSILVHRHRRRARENPGTRPMDELKIALDLLLFELTSGTLYCFIWLFGPVHAATLLAWSMDLPKKLLVAAPMPITRPGHTKSF